MKFDPPLIQAKLLKRYKRFLADVHHESLGEFTVHCPNTGSMKNCWQADDSIWLHDSNNPKRKYRYTWTLRQSSNGDFLCVNTQLANGIVSEAINAQRIPELQGYSDLQQEVRYGEENSRIDLLLSASETGSPNCYVEIKTVTLLEETSAEEGKGYFPDSVSTRGQKHLRELIHIVQQGYRAVLFFLVQHSGIDSVQAAAHIDPAYAELLKKAVDSGVEILAYRTHISPAEIIISDKLSVHT